MALVPRLLQRVGRPLSGAVGQTRVLIASYHEKVRVYGLFSLRYSSKELGVFFVFFLDDATLWLCVFVSQVIDHYENPRNVGSLDKNDANVGTGLVGAPACGDVMKLQVLTTCVVVTTTNGLR